MERELKRGTLELVLLRLLAERPMYGYEIAASIDERSRGEYRIADGSLYPVLYRLEAAGLIEPRWETQQRGVPRKYYEATEAGRRALAERMSEWRRFSRAVDDILDGTEA